jgi:hypothetical protein
VTTATLTGHLTGDTAATGDVTLTLHLPDQPPPVDVPEMLVGLTAQSQDFDTYLAPGAPFARAAFCRTFAQPGDGVTPPASRTALPAGVAEWRSFKDYPTDAALTGYLDRVTRPTWLTFRHEHDNGKTAAEQSKASRADFFARNRHLFDVIDDHPNRPLVTFVNVQTLQWTAAKSTADTIKGDGDWRPWWPGVGDGVGFDCYVDSWATGYPPVESFFRIPLEAAQGAGRPLWVPELGSVLLGGDTGPGRAAWMLDALSYLAEQGCRGVAWWCAPGANDRDFRLTDALSRTAWQAAMT